MPKLVIDNFLGLDAYTDAGQLLAGQCTVCDNVFVDGVRPYYTPFGPTGLKGGDLVSRPGVAGQIGSANLAYNAGKPAVSPMAFLLASGATKVLFASGTAGGSDATLWAWDKSNPASAPVAITGVSGLHTNGVRMARLGGYAYVVDGVGSLLRITDTSGAEALAMQPETTAPVASLTNLPVDALGSGELANWHVDQITGSPVNGMPVQSSVAGSFAQFSTGTEYGPGQPGGSAAYGWTFSGPDNDFDTSAAGWHQLPSAFSGAGNYTFLDDPLEGMQWTAAAANSAINNEAAGDYTRYASQFAYNVPYYQGDASEQQGLCIEVIVYSDTLGTTEITRKADTFAPGGNRGAVPYNASAQPGQALQGIIDFPNLGVEILSYRFNVFAPPTNVRVPTVTESAACYVGGSVAGVATLSCGPISNNISLSAASPSGGGGIQISSLNTAHAAGGVGACRMTCDYTTAQNWSAYDTVVLNLASVGVYSAATLVANGLKLMLGFRASGATTHYWSNPMTMDASGTYASVDITTIPAAVRAAFRFLEVLFLADIGEIAPGGSATTPLLAITSISTAGNLSTSPSGIASGYAPVFYVVTEIDDEGDASVVNVIESDWSPASAALSPTALDAVVTLVLPPPTNAQATHYSIYRFGGVYTDGYGRLIATVPVGSDIATGADTLARDQSNPYIAWNHATLTLTDNTPDSFLFGAVVAEIGRGVPPTGAQAIAAWQGRVWLAVGSNVSASWLLQAGLENGLYFTAANLPNDPDGIIKGATFSVGAADNDPVVALVPLGGALLVLKAYSTWLVQGSDPTNFTCQELVCGGASVGCVAPRTACVVGGMQVWWLGADGVYGFDGSSITLQSLVLDPYLNAQAAAASAQVTASVRALSAMAEWNKKVFLLSAMPGDTANTVAFVYGTQTNTWTRYTSFGFTGAAALSAETDTGDFYLTGEGGQVYVHGYQAGASDTAYPGAAATAITVTLQSKGLGQETPDETSFQKTRPTRVFVVAQTGAAVTLTLTVTGDDSAGAYTKTHATSAAGVIDIQSKVPPSARGSLVYLGLSAATTGQLRLRRLAADFAKGTIGR